MILAFLSGCQKTEDEGIYITFIKTSRSQRQTIYYFNINDEEVYSMKSLHPNLRSQSGAYNRDKQKIYYSAMTEDGHDEQLWEYNIETDERTQLIDGAYGINYIVSADDSVYLVAWCHDNEYGARNFYRYDIKSKSLELLQDDPTFNVGVLSYSSQNKEFMFAGEDAVESWHRHDIQSDEYPFYPPANNVYSMKDNEIKLVFSTEDNEDIVALAMNDKYILYRTRSVSWTLYVNDSNSVEEIRHVYLMNRETNEKTELTDEIFNSINSFIYLANNDDLYCIYYSDDYLQIIKLNLNDLSSVHQIYREVAEYYSFSDGLALN